jgi:hypothetical protein
MPGSCTDLRRAPFEGLGIEMSREQTDCETQ